MVLRLVFTLGGLEIGIVLGQMTYNMLISFTQKNGGFSELSGIAGLGVLIALIFLGSEVGKSIKLNTR
jgi:hypothetical protein